MKIRFGSFNTSTKQISSSYFTFNGEDSSGSKNKAYWQATIRYPDLDHYVVSFSNRCPASTKGIGASAVTIPERIDTEPYARVYLSAEGQPLKITYSDAHVSADMKKDALAMCKACTFEWSKAEGKYLPKAS